MTSPPAERGTECRYEDIMARLDQTDFAMRVVIDRPMIGAMHSLQASNQGVFDPKCSEMDQPLAPDFSVRMGLGPKFLGDQVRRKGRSRRFVSIGIGQLAGVAPSPWSRRMTIDIHDIERDLLDRAAHEARADGIPACATLQPVARRLTDPVVQHRHAAPLSDHPDGPDKRLCAFVALGGYEFVYKCMSAHVPFRIGTKAEPGRLARVPANMPPHRICAKA